MEQSDRHRENWKRKSQVNSSNYANNTKEYTRQHILEAAVSELTELRNQPITIEQRRVRRKEILLVIKENAAGDSLEQIFENFATTLTDAAYTTFTLLDKIYQEIDLAGWIKKRVEAQSGSSVAAVFDLCSDVLRLNLLIGLIILFAIVVPAVVWEDDRKIPNEILSKEYDLDEYFHYFGEKSKEEVSDLDQCWGWVTENYNLTDEWQSKYENSSLFQCSHVDLVNDNELVRECSIIYITNSTTASQFTTFIAFVLDFIKGTGFIERSPLFIGWYPAHLGRSSSIYSIDWAYSLTMITAYIISIVFVVKNYGHWLRNRTDFFNYDYMFSNIIFKGWDFNISNSFAAGTEKMFTVMELSAADTEMKFIEKKESRSSHQKNMLLMKRIGVNIVVTVMIISGWTCIYFVVTRVKGDKFWEQYAATMTISLFNNVYPPIFFALSLFEKYRSQTELLVYIMRSICLRLVSIVILAGSEISNKLQEEDDIGNCHMDNLCWETRLAQRIYSLTIFETFFHFPITLLVVIRYLLGFLPKDFILARKLPAVIWDFLSNPEFDSAAQVLKVVYLQTLCWMGMLCTPLLPIITVMALLLIIILNAAVLFLCNLKPGTACRASSSSSVFMIAMLVGLILSILPSLLVLSHLEPSPGCTPYRGLSYQYQSVEFGFCDASDFTRGLASFTTNFFFVAGLLFVLFLSLVYFLAISKAKKSQIKDYEKKLRRISQSMQSMRNKYKTSYSEVR